MAKRTIYPEVSDADRVQQGRNMVRAIIHDRTGGRNVQRVRLAHALEHVESVEGWETPPDVAAWIAEHGLEPEAPKPRGRGLRNRPAPLPEVDTGLSAED